MLAENVIYIFITLSPLIFCRFKVLRYFLFRLRDHKIKSNSMDFYPARKGDVKEICIHVMSPKLWNCINFEMAFCHIAKIFFLIGHQRKMNSMWHKMKLLLAYEYFRALFKALCKKWWRVEFVSPLKWKYLMEHEVRWRFLPLDGNSIIYAQTIFNEENLRNFFVL